MQHLEHLLHNHIFIYRYGLLVSPCILLSTSSHDLQVLRYCFFLWNRLGNKKFNRLRGIAILPNIRTLQRFKRKYVGSGSGYQKNMFVKAAKLWGSQAKSDEDSESEHFRLHNLLVKIRPYFLRSNNSLSIQQYSIINYIPSGSSLVQF